MARVLDLIEEAFDEVAFAWRKIALPRGFAVGLGRDDRVIPRWVRVPTNGSASYALSPIRASGSALLISGSAQAIMSSTWREHQLHGIAQGVDGA